MSDIPPYTPLGGSTPPPIPPYDPRAAWRVYRAQQKAAARAQRDAWKAQRYAMKANYLSARGPRLSSIVYPILLLTVGVTALLLLSGRIAAGQFWSWYGRWWPLVLIGAGLISLGEWLLDLRRKLPVRRSGGFVGILIPLALLGFAAAGWSHMRPWFSPLNDQNQWGLNDDLAKAFGLPEHDFDQPVVSAQIPLQSAIEIQNPRGDVSVTAGDSPTIEVQAHEVAFVNSEAGARKIFDAEAAHLTVNGNAVLLHTEMNPSGHVNLSVTVPRSAHVTIRSDKGNLTATGLGAGIGITASHSNVQLNAIAGPAEVHFTGGRHSFSAHQIDGDLAFDGDLNDVNLSEIKGRVTQNGEILGNVRMEKISAPIHLHTSVTDVEVAELPGDLTLNPDELRITEAKGTVRVITYSKDVDLSQIDGASQVENHDGSVSVEPAGNYAVEVKNRQGNVNVTLPANASATIEGHARNGDIVTDFGLTVSGDENKTVSGRLGSGTARILLGTENGDLRIKKSASLPVASPASTASPYHRGPSLSSTPRLNRSKSQQPQPVMQ